MRGWHKESYRHYLAAKGIKTGRYYNKKNIYNYVRLSKDEGAKGAAYTKVGNSDDIFIRDMRGATLKDTAETINHEELHNVLSKLGEEDASKRLDFIHGLQKDGSQGFDVGPEYKRGIYKVNLENRTSLNYSPEKRIKSLELMKMYAKEAYLIDKDLFKNEYDYAIAQFNKEIDGLKNPKGSSGPALFASKKYFADMPVKEVEDIKQDMMTDMKAKYSNKYKEIYTTMIGELSPMYNIDNYNERVALFKKARSLTSAKMQKEPVHRDYGRLRLSFHREDPAIKERDNAYHRDYVKNLPAERKQELRDNKNKWVAENIESVRIAKRVTRDPVKEKEYTEKYYSLPENKAKQHEQYVKYMSDPAHLAQRSKRMKQYYVDVEKPRRAEKKFRDINKDILEKVKDDLA